MAGVTLTSAAACTLWGSIIVGEAIGFAGFAGHVARVIIENYAPAAAFVGVAIGLTSLIAGMKRGVFDDSIQKAEQNNTESKQIE